MKLYERDYTRLTINEETELGSLRQPDPIPNTRHLKVIRPIQNKVLRHHQSLFPNNYLDIVELEDHGFLKKQIETIQELLDSSGVSEQAILNFIKLKQAYFIVASLLKSYFRFGHHEAYLFPEFQLGNSYKPDYLLVGKNSGGWEFLFVELESPTELITMANGELGSAFRKGIAQIEDWMGWLETYYGSLKETFDKCKGANVNLPDEFSRLDTTRLHYVVIAGRRKNFLPKTYQKRRRKQNKILILHYDNLVDPSQNLIGSRTY
ncbi:MAG: Shedu anti-phage system protein SduA domain-containing protein [Nitrospirota bacterium]